MTTPQFTVALVEGRFQTQDETGAVYGTYGTQAEAEENAGLWAEYFEAPLIC